MSIEGVGGIVSKVPKQTICTAGRDECGRRFEKHIFKCLRAGGSACIADGVDFIRHD